jgi:hypothetical protein
MSALAQTIAVIVLLVAALAFLIYHFVAHRRSRHKCEDCDVARLLENRHRGIRSRRFPLH